LEWEPEERDAWRTDAERWICQLKDVLECKIDLDAQGEIASVHVVAGMDRDPRHIVRDVEGLLKARLQMDVYYKKIGVVQVVDNERGQRELAAEAGILHDFDPAPPERGSVTFHPPGGEAAAAPQAQRETRHEPAPEPAPRPDAPASAPRPAILVAEDGAPRIVCSGVSVMASDRMVRAEVQLLAGEIEAGGTAEGANHADADVVLVARATLQAVERLLALPPLLHLREVRIVALGGHDVVLTAVDLVESRRSESLFGTCAARHNRQQAVVHAVLDSLNRRLGLQGYKEAAAEA